jgi:hypothetical protein
MGSGAEKRPSRKEMIEPSSAPTCGLYLTCGHLLRGLDRGRFGIVFSDGAFA